MAHPALELQSRRTLGNLRIGPTRDWFYHKKAKACTWDRIILSINQDRGPTVCGGKDLDVTAEYEPTSDTNAEKVATPWKSLIQKMNLSSSMWLR